MLGQWRKSIGASWSQPSYAPVGQPENEQQKKNLTVSLRECVGSKVFWRLILLFATILLIFNLMTPAKETLAQYGWTNPVAAVSGATDSKETESLVQAQPANPVCTDNVNWSDYAYCQYVTNEDYLCNSLMIFEALVRVGAKADRIMMYPAQWAVEPGTRAGRLLVQARDQYGVALVPIEVQHYDGDSTWAESFTKLLAFNQTQYKRVLSLDSDATVLKPMDELFLMPSAPVAMPRAYWLDEFYLSSQLVLVEPSDFEFNRILAAFDNRGTKDFDMEIVNNLYGDSCFIIPHRRYDLLTGEFKGSEHFKYLGSKEAKWDPEEALEEAKFLHFSDWPISKPWIHSSEAQMEHEQPKCHQTKDGKEDCRDRDFWRGFYTEFAERRQRVCGSDFVKRQSKRDLYDEKELVAPKFEPVFRK